MKNLLKNTLILLGLQRFDAIDSVQNITDFEDTVTVLLSAAMIIYLHDIVLQVQ